MNGALRVAGVKVLAPEVVDGANGKENVAEWIDEGGKDFVDDRPRILSDEAFKKRRQDVELAVAERQKNKNAKPFKRLIKVVHWDVLHDVFNGRGTNPLTVAEYGAYRDKALAELPEDCGDPQFTGRANNRVANSYFEDQLRQEVFHGRSNVDLLEVEQAIVILEQKGGKRGLEVNLDVLVACGEKTGGGVCVSEFLPRCYLNKNDKVRGNYSPDMFDEKVVAVCPPCQEFLVGRLVERNKAIIAACRICRELDKKDEDGRHNDHATDPKNKTAFVPRFLSKEDAEEVVERRMFAINRGKEKKRLAEEVKAQQERDGSADRFIKHMVDRRNQYTPETKRGQSRNGNRSDSHRRRDRYDD
ncbi:MAG: hypothetical protein Q8Q46_01675 [Candidatus Giovannonibacteria bacterium]|nr:hypothetical protein [Candidatus Giovannonibacteria bacterium]